jgi:hypothetical protein
MGRADESTVLSVSFAIFLPDCENVVLSVVGRGALGKFYWMIQDGIPGALPRESLHPVRSTYQILRFSVSEFDISTVMF